MRKIASDSAEPVVVVSDLAPSMLGSIVFTMAGSVHATGD